jgi:hypothetical protein
MRFWIARNARDLNRWGTSSLCLRKETLRGFSYLVGWLLGLNSTNEVQIRVFGRLQV